MDIGKETRRDSGLPNLNALDPETLKALVLSQQAEIENLKLLVLKLKRMHFGAKSEKLNADIQQLELRLEELEANQAASRSVARATCRCRHGFEETRTPSASRGTAS